MISWNMAIYAAGDRYSGWTMQYSGNEESLRNALMLHHYPEAETDHRDNVLHFFARSRGYGDEKEDLKTIKYYVEKGGKINHKNSMSQTPLHAAIWSDAKISMVQNLLKYEADPSLRDCFGRTALEVCRIHRCNLTAEDRNSPEKTHFKSVIELLRKPLRYHRQLLWAWVEGVAIHSRE